MIIKQKSNWKIVTLLALMGAVPALPGAFIVMTILQGLPPDGADSFVRAVYFANPVPIITHAIAGIIFAALVPFQFAPRIRARWPRWHRNSGRTAIAAGFVMALSAIWMLVTFPQVGGFLRISGLAVTGFGMILTLGIALHAIMRRRDIKRHRAWMMRAVAVTYGVIGVAPVVIPAFIIMGEDLPPIVDELSRWIGMAITLSVVEWVLHHERAGKVRRITPSVNAA